MVKFIDFGETAEHFRPSLKTIFNGFNLDDEISDGTGSFMTLSVSGRNDSEYDITTYDVPGLDGVIEEDNPTLNPRIISVRFRIKDETSTGLQRKFEKLRSLLEGSKKELSFTDDEFFFYATNQRLETPDETSNSLTSVITFLCSDPYKYGPEKVLGFPSDLVVVNNEGTTDAFPVYEMTVLTPITFAMVQNQLQEAMLIGEPADVDSQIINERNLIIDERGDSLSQWNTSPIKIDSSTAVIIGDIGTDSTGIVPLNYGSGLNWHGPARAIEIDPIQDFEVEMFCRVELTKPTDTFRIETYLFDENLNVIGKIAIVDSTTNSSQVAVEGRQGDWTGINENYAISSRNYLRKGNHFHGLVRMSRKGNQIIFYAARLGSGDNPIHHDTLRVTRNITDSNLLGKLKYVQIHFGKYGNSTNALVPRINRLKVTELQSVEEDQTPYIAYPGDIITFDTQSEEMLINGEDAMEHKDFISQFFSLKKGENTLGVLPENALDVQMRYKERRK